LPPDGTSLLPVLQNPNTPRTDTVFLEEPINARYFGITDTDWKYVERNGGVLQLYDLTADPYELTNVTDQPPYQAIQNQLAQVLSTFKPGAPTPTPTITPTTTPTATVTATPTTMPTTMPTTTPTATPVVPSPPESFEALLPLIRK
jgi:hypothetical protein